MYVMTAAAAGLGLPPGAAATGPECGSIKGMQKMLADLGYYYGDIDGALDKHMLGVVDTFARAEGVPAYAGAQLSDAFCGRLAHRWNEKFGMKPALFRQRIAASSPVVTQQRTLVDTTSGGMPSLDPAKIACTLTGRMWDESTQTCVEFPPDTTAYDTPADELSAVEACLQSGGGWLDGECIHPETGERMEYIHEAGITVGPPKGWWEKQDTAIKVAIIGGGVLVVLGAGYALTR